MNWFGSCTLYVSACLEAQPGHSLYITSYFMFVVYTERCQILKVDLVTNITDPRSLELSSEAVESCERCSFEMQATASPE